MERFPVNGDERKRIGYIHEFHMNMGSKAWVADQDLNNTTDKNVINDVKNWLHGLAVPWSNTSVHYTINHNFTPGHTEDEEWVANYVSIFYDCMESVVVAHGKTPEEALNNVMALTELVLKYYVDNDED